MNQLECFRAYLASGRAPRWTMGADDLHGFLTGLAIAGPLPEKEWLPWIWSGDMPDFASDHEAWSVTSELLAFAEQVRRSLGSYRILSPALLHHAGEGRFVLADWAEGFMQAIAANPAPWQRALDTAEQSLSIVLSACYDNLDDTNTGLVDADGLDEMNYHLRHLTRIMRTDPGYMQAPAKAA